MPKLIAIGYWHSLELGRNNDYPDPRSLVDDDWCAKDRDAICAYLDGGNSLFQWRGYSTCRFFCGVTSPEMGSQCLTDGMWAWPEGLSHYIRDHHVRLPNEVVDHMRSSNWSIAPFAPRQLQV